ncbi:hypothetical protein GQ44DRAFT_609221 [Phaeosphaeriaceae sp. PMI808]|nr:hypothetical protein GQ44DRAFT_609221 [Phaeosphaeriaceae sp. PMI808]
MSGKRANIFDQGRPESPYEDRDGPAEVPQRATAAQLATRKIKTAKARRPATGNSTTLFSSGQQSPFGIAATAPASSSTSNGFFGGNGMFGGNTTNSFPPAQSSAPSNSFTNSSFPAFGTSASTSTTTTFNPQPPSSTAFSFAAAGTTPNIFNSTNGASMMNGNNNGNANGSSAPFGGSNSMFSSQTPTTSGGLFGTSSGLSSTSMFGTSSAAPISSTTPAAAPAPFAFGGGVSAPAQNNTIAPATQNNMFSGFGSNTQPGGMAQKGAPQNGLFGMGTTAQGSGAATSTAPSTTSLFGFGSNPQPNTSATTTAPLLNMFGPTAAPSSNMFGTPSESTSVFGQQTPQTQTNASSTAGNPFANIKAPEEKENTPKPSLFSSIKTPAPSIGTTTEASKPSLFSSLAKPAPAASTPGFSLFGGLQNKDSGSEKSSGVATPSASEAGKSNLFAGGLSTPQPAKTAQTEKPQANLFSAAQPKTNSGLFSQSFQPENHNSGNTFKPASTFSGFNQSSTSTGLSKDTTTQSTTTKAASNPFASISTPPADRPNLFVQSKEQASISSPSAMSAPTGPLSSNDMSNGPELPRIPKAHVPKEWNTAVAPSALISDSSHSLLISLTAQLQQLNENYRAKLNKLPPAADWAALSLWHHQHSSAIKTKIDIAKKQRAAAKGVTGNESSLSTKRKVNDQSPEDRDNSPTKRARPANAVSTPTPQPSIPTPKFNPPATATSSIFAKAINNKPSAPTEPSKPHASEPSQPTATGFQPSFSASNGAVTSQPLFSASGFKPTTSTSTGGSGGFKPVTSSTSGGFASQFAASAKTYEQLAAERKKKAMDEDYDSDDETKAEWSARYDKKEAERIAKEKAAAALTPAFSLSKPVSGASTPGLFTPRPASPALSTGGQSVFDAGSTAQTPSSNIFGHLSSGPSSNNQEESDEEDARLRNDQFVGSVEPTTPPKRKFGESETEADDSHDERTITKQNNTLKGSLMSRMTRGDGDGSESEKENSNAGSIFGQTNGTQTPTNKPFSFFDFGAAGAKTAPPKSDTFAGDQTFKPGTPIKFGEGAATEKKAAPTFQFQPASASTTPSKPPPASLFNFGLSGLTSAPSSVFSSRAATPLSEAETSAASAAEDDEEGTKHEQVDLSKLTEGELEANEVVFETEQALAKHQVDKGDGTKAWENFARGPLYILKDKVTGKCFVRIRISSGQTPLNYSILPALKSNVTGSSGKMVQATMPKKEGGFTQFFISLRTPEIARELSEKYNASLPS